MNNFQRIAVFSLGLSTLGLLGLLLACQAPLPAKTAAVTKAPLVDPPKAPVAAKKPQVTELHGDRLVDDYSWLRERDDPAVLAYLEAEKIYTRTVTSHTAEFRDQLYHELAGRLQEEDSTMPFPHGDYFYYSRTEKGKPYDIYCRKKGSLEAPEELLLDTNLEAEDHEFYRNGDLEMSPDHRLLAYTEDTAGTESYSLRVRRIADGVELADRVEGLSVGLIWGNDSKTLYYTVLNETSRSYKVFRHILGTPAAADEELFHEEDAAFNVWMWKARSQRYVMLLSSSSTTAEMHLLDADQPDSQFNLFQARQPQVRYSLYHNEAGMFVRTNEGGDQGYRLMLAPAGNSDPNTWKRIIDHRQQVRLDTIEEFKNFLVITERVAGLKRMRVLDTTTFESQYIEMPDSVYGVWAEQNAEYDTELFRFTYSSMIAPQSVYDYDISSHRRELKKEQKVPGFDRSEYLTERVYARAEDGVAIPISLAYKKGIERDGSHPMLLYGYGSYGVNLSNFFDADRFSLLDRGWVYAMAHVRGGGDLGEQWHRDGKLLDKRNTFTDFVASAEHLIAQRYTSSDRLAINGGSAGGLLIGGVLNMRPDLFAAAVADVPFVDLMNTMLDDSLPLTVGEYEEWGNPHEKQAYFYMKSYSPYDNVTGQDYPALLVNASFNDSRVPYWEAAKWVAKLRAMKTGDQQLLLNINMGAGHGGASGRYEEVEEIAFDYAFLIDNLPAAGGSAARP